MHSSDLHVAACCSCQQLKQRLLIPHRGLSPRPLLRQPPTATPGNILIEPCCPSGVYNLQHDDNHSHVRSQSLPWYQHLDLSRSGPNCFADLCDAHPRCIRLASRQSGVSCVTESDRLVQGKKHAKKRKAKKKIGKAAKRVLNFLTPSKAAAKAPLAPEAANEKRALPGPASPAPSPAAPPSKTPVSRAKALGSAILNRMTPRSRKTVCYGLHM